MNYAHKLYLNDELITDLVIPSSVTWIGYYAFRGCSGLTNVIIGNSVTSIGNYAFSGCTGLTSVTIGNSVTSIGNFAFSGCTSLTSVVIPESVTEIGSDAFSGCSGLASVTLPNSVTEIKDFTFSGCKRIKDITIPNSVRTIGRYAFGSCPIINLVIPNSVTTIGYRAFSHTDYMSIKNLILPKSVTSVDEYAFPCDQSVQVYVEYENPTGLGSNYPFYNSKYADSVIADGTLYVPIGTKEKYQKHNIWSRFRNIVEYDPAGVEEIEAEGGVTIGVEGGKIVVNGAGDAKVKVFGTNGAAVYSGSADNLPELVAGIYIVRVGSTIKKVSIAQ